MNRLSRSVRHAMAAVAIGGEVSDIAFAHGVSSKDARYLLSLQGPVAEESGIRERPVC